MMFDFTIDGKFIVIKHLLKTKLLFFLFPIIDNDRLIYRCIDRY